MIDLELAQETAALNKLKISVKTLQDDFERIRYRKEGGECNDEEINRLQLENTKLKHRLSILQKALEAEKTCGNKLIETNNGMISILDHLTELFTNAIIKAFPALSGKIVASIAPVNASNSKFGDYQCNSAMSLSKALRSTGLTKSPRDIAQEILNKTENSELIDKMELAGAGFINVFLSKSYVVKHLTNILKFGVKPPRVEPVRVLIDYSSPNIAKEMHVGHLRSTIIGESIARLLEFLGHDVVRHNHIGDWGTQFGMLIAHLEDIFPNFLVESPPISDLQKFYKESKKRFDEDEDFKKRAYNRVVELQNGEQNCVKAWKLICDVSRNEFQKIYERLDVTLIEKGESFYQDHMIQLITYLESNNFLELDDGRKILWPEKPNSGIPLTIVKSDGGFTYDTSDLAAIRYRLEDEKADWIIYVVDAGQSMHFNAIFSAAEKCGFLKPDKHRVEHVQFGVVLGEDGKKFKTRSGDTVKLSELLDEGLKRSLDKLIEKERDNVLTVEELQAAQQSVAYGCIKYADLCHNRTHEYVFSFDKMLEDRGNTAVYLLYAYTRISSIVRNCGENINGIIEKATIVLEHEKEWKLAKTLFKFVDVILKVSNDHLLNTLCEFCYEVCTTFSEFYDNCYCIVKNQDSQIVNVNYSRILLCHVTAIILYKCFHILGLKPIDKI